MPQKYFHCACESLDTKCNPKFKHYFRLYKVTGKGPVLVEQGSTLKDWETRFSSTFGDNPYPHLD